ncbi:hypothetical protein BIW11_02966 [Tropilaelaps mercedesae]|uniref:Uncharacterized protein n=1 Tax=Tropilaelaps mercedesae TaxID=418985 RepID=A0A1V9XU83_9ACAR|nr:hypothetical protein BIW11_02966 [Tropilaelaps mercedesae]
MLMVLQMMMKTNNVIVPVTVVAYQADRRMNENGHLGFDEVISGPPRAAIQQSNVEYGEGSKKGTK